MNKCYEDKPQGELAIATMAMPASTNANGDIFGGWLISQMDLAGGVIAKQRARSRSVTVAIDAMVFLCPVHIGDLVRCYGEVIHVGRTSMKIKIEAWTLRNETGIEQKVTEGVFTFVAIDDHGIPQAVDREEKKDN